MMEDKVLLEQPFQFHSKIFHRIEQMLPVKSSAAVAKYIVAGRKERQEPASWIVKPGKTDSYSNTQPHPSIFLLVKKSEGSCILVSLPEAKNPGQDAILGH